MDLRRRLQRNWDRIRTEPGLKRNVIMIVALTVLALGAGGWILGNQNFNAPWSDKFQLAAEFEAVPGLAPGQGQEVRMHGVMIGQITDARVNDDGRAEVAMALDEGYDIYENATLVLRPKSPLNEMYVEIDPGGPPAGKVADGETLPVTNTERPVQLDEVLGHLDDDARAGLTALLAEADVATARARRDLPGGLDAATDVSTDLAPVVTELRERQKSIRKLVTALSQISEAVGEDDARLAELARSLSSTLGSMADHEGDLDATLRQLPGLSDRLATSTKAVSDLAEQLDPTLRDLQGASDTLPAALERLDSTLGRLQTTVEIARPVVKDARPVVRNLRPAVSDFKVALPIAERTTQRLDPVTAQLVDHLPDLGAFIIQTRSLTSLRDANGGIFRGQIVITPTSLPTDVLAGLSGDDATGGR